MIYAVTRLVNFILSPGSAQSDCSLNKEGIDRNDGGSKGCDIDDTSGRKEATDVQETEEGDVSESGIEEGGASEGDCDYQELSYGGDIAGGDVTGETAEIVDSEQCNLIGEPFEGRTIDEREASMISHVLKGKFFPGFNDYEHLTTTCNIPSWMITAYANCGNKIEGYPVRFLRIHKACYVDSHASH